MQREKRRRQVLGLISAVAGFGLIGLSWPPDPGFDWRLWSVFAAAYVVLGLTSVEVNERQLASSSSMVILTAGVYFATLEGSSPMLALALLGGVGLLGPGDISGRRVFLPLVNFGQQVVSAVAATAVLMLLIDAVPRGSSLVDGLLIRMVGATAVAAVLHTALNYTLVHLVVRFAYGTRQVVPWSRIGLLSLSHTSMGVLGGLLGAVLFRSDLAAIPLILIVYVIGQVVVVSYARLREAHESTLRGFILALEARDLYTRGHTERVAYFSRLIGEQLAFTGTQLEQLRWAAIIHDMGKLAIPVEVMQKQGRLTDAEYRRLRRASHKVDDLLSEVDFLRPMVVLCSGTHTRMAGEDFGQTGHTHSNKPNLEQMVLAVADAFDAMTSTRGYRMAMSQSDTLDALRKDEGSLYDNGVINALEKGLASVGRTYGPLSIEVGTPEEAAGV